jgi:hypothetical protein
VGEGYHEAHGLYSGSAVVTMGNRADDGRPGAEAADVPDSCIEGFVLA